MLEFHICQFSSAFFTRWISGLRLASSFARNPMTSGRRSRARERERERANIIPGKRHLFDGGRQRCTKERTTSISSPRHQFGGDRTIVRRGGTMMGRPFGNTSSSIRDRFMLGGLKLGQSLSHTDLLPPKNMAK